MSIDPRQCGGFIYDRNWGDKMSVSDKIVKGTFWILFLRISNRLLGFVRTVVLARLLAPEDFGLMGIAALTIATIEVFSQPGIGMSLIQKKENIEKYLDTAWTVSVVRAVIIFLLLYVFAPYTSKFFNVPQADSVIKVFGFSVLITGCRNIGVIYFQKRMNFKLQYIYEFSTTLGNLVVAVPAALMLKSVWALVLGGIAGSLVRLVMSYLLNSYRPKLQFDTEKFVEMFRYGKWILGSGVLFFLITQGDDIFLGKMFGATALGLYQMAFMVSNLPTTEIARVIGYVTFPAYSKIQKDKTEFGDIYLKVMHIITVTSVIMTGSIFMLADDLTKVVLGPKWVSIVPMMQILAWSGLVRAMSATLVPVFNAAGKPGINTKCQSIGLVVLAAVIVPCSLVWDINGVPVSVLASNIVMFLVYVVVSSRIIDFDMLKLIKIIVLALINMGLSLQAASWIQIMLPLHGAMQLLVTGGALLIIYLSATLLSDKLFSHNTGYMLKQSLAVLLKRQV